jgi:predicted methyltransferase
MNTFVKKAGFAVMLTLGLSTFAMALPADFAEKMASPSRPQADKDRDAARKPMETMEALGVQEGWTVVDVSAGGGWFSTVLSAAVGPQGKVLSQFGARALQNNNGQAQRDLAASLGNVEPMFVPMAEMPAGTADAAVTALNFHDAFNFRGDEGATAFLADIFNVLKSGGVAAIIDHEGTAGAANNDLHRIPAAVVREYLVKVGFEIVTESDLLNNAADDHSLSSSDDSLGQATDQLLFIVKKP